MNAIRLNSLPVHLRRLLTAFLITSAVGFFLGAFFVEHTTRLEPSGITERFKGTEQMGIDLDDLPPDREIQYEKSTTDILNITHTHVIALSMLFLLVGGIFSFTHLLPGWLKTALMVEPFLSILLTFGGMWLLADGPPWWSLVIGASGLLMTLCFTGMILVSLIELWVRPK